MIANCSASQNDDNDDGKMTEIRYAFDYCTKIGGQIPSTPY